MRALQNYTSGKKEFTTEDTEDTGKKAKPRTNHKGHEGKQKGQSLGSGLCSRDGD